MFTYPMTSGGGGGGLTGDLVSVYEFNSDDLTDSHGSNNLAIGAGAPAYAAGTITARKLQTDFPDRYEKAVPHGMNGGTHDFTVAGWFTRGDNAVRVLANLGTAVTAASDWMIMKPADNILEFYVNGDSSTNYKAQWGSAMTINTLYFVVCSWEYATKTISINFNNGTPVTATGPTVPNNNGAGFEFCSSGNVSEWWKGDVDQWAYWTRILTAGEQTSLYNGGAGLPYASW